MEVRYHYFATYSTWIQEDLDTNKSNDWKVSGDRKHRLLGLFLRGWHESACLKEAVERFGENPERMIEMGDAATEFDIEEVRDVTGTDVECLFVIKCYIYN